MVDSASDSATLVRDALDHAISEVAKEEERRLCRRVAVESQERHVYDGLDSLLKLQQGIEPDYDSEWLSVLYLTWYHPRQIHLAYASLRRFIEQDGPPPHVIDYGCGAWAVQFALAMALAEMRNPRVSGIGVHGIEPAKPMREIGTKLWKKMMRVLNERKSNHSFIASLHNAMQSVGRASRPYATREGAVAALQAATRATDAYWLTAVHAVYGTNQADLKDLLDSLDKRKAPELALVTFFRPGNSHESRAGGRLHWTSFFRALGFTEAQPDVVWTGEFARTTRWRKSLSERLSGLDWRKKLLLTKYPVTWDPRRRLANGEDVVMVRRGAQ